MMRIVKAELNCGGPVTADVRPRRFFSVAAMTFSLALLINGLQTDAHAYLLIRSGLAHVSTLYPHHRLLDGNVRPCG